jgi:uncharacterized protein YggU (UPF0235/DUF167 family)
VEIIAGRKSRRKTVKLRSAEQKQTKELIKKLQQLSK